MRFVFLGVSVFRCFGVSDGLGNFAMGALE